jgi:hypothetical protein
MVDVQEWEAKPMAKRGSDLNVGATSLCQLLESQGLLLKHTD